MTLAIIMDRQKLPSGRSPTGRRLNLACTTVAARSHYRTEKVDRRVDQSHHCHYF